MRDQAERLRALAAKVHAPPEPELRGTDRARVVAVTSGKGGVGKTTVVANLGTALAARGLAVALLDADFGLANLDILLNANPAKNLGHLLRGEAEPREIVFEAGTGIKLIPGASGLEALADLGSPERDALLARLAPLTLGEDFVLVDTAAGIGRGVIEPCAAAGEVVLVTNAEPTSLTDAYGLVKVLVGRKPEAVIRVLVNSVATPEEAAAVFGRFDEVVSRFLRRHLSYLGHIERDPCVGRATGRQVPFVTAYPRSPAARCVAAVADALLGAAASAESGSFWRRLLTAGGSRG